MSPLTSYTKIIFSLSLLCGLSVSLFSQGFIDRRIDDYAAKIYTNLYCNNDSLILIGWGAVFQPTVPGKINITKFLKDGTFVEESIFTFSDDIDYLPWLQGSSKKLNNDIYISGSGGLGAVNQAGFISKYNLDNDSIEWVYNIEPDVFSSNSILIETEVLSSNNIVGVMIESLDTFPLNSYVRFLKWDQNGNLINEKIIDDNGVRYTTRSLLLNNENGLILGLDVVPEGLPLSLQLWKLDTLGNILDV